LTGTKARLQIYTLITTLFCFLTLTHSHPQWRSESVRPWTGGV